MTFLLGNKTDAQMKKRGKPKNKLLTIENKQMVTRGEVYGGRGEIGEKDEEYTNLGEQ